ncbi:putative lariat debranching enzyme [Tuber brumale]|nr:putative lariat debranching enzyme [Tuber brumale]
MSAIRIAVEGCGHGTLNAIYDSIQHTCKINRLPPVDLLIIGGDFQAVRNLRDLNVMSCPQKYRALGDFHEYYSGVRKAPMLTVFVGGNHEASSHLWELLYGGWVAPSIYYLGAASVLNFRGLRIGGLSGIYNGRDYARPHDERLPYFPSEVKSIYHVRQYDVFKLYQINEPVDVMISHDWPSGIEHHGDLNELLRRKSFFKSDIEKGELGSPPARSLLNKLKPRYWFSAHLHVKFAALVDHGGKVTNFLALDKCLPRREFLQLLTIPTIESKSGLSYDPEWLAITRALNPYLHKHPSALNSDAFKEAIGPMIALERGWVEENIVAKGKLGVPENFQITAPIHEGSLTAREDRLPESYVNTQTTAFCELLGIEDGTRFAPPGSEGKEEKYRSFMANGGGSYSRGGRGGGGSGGRGRGGRGMRGGGGGRGRR